MEVMMDYFKIYPQAVYLYPEADGQLSGLLHYQLEQYGCFYKSRTCSVQVIKDESVDGKWSMVAPEFEAGNSSFVGFMEALNYYMIGVLGLDPFEAVEGSHKRSVSVHFNDVLFDVESRQMVKASPPPTTPSLRV